jgi:hypothetical protein
LFGSSIEKLGFGRFSGKESSWFKLGNFSANNMILIFGCLKLAALPKGNAQKQAVEFYCQ